MKNSANLLTLALALGGLATVSLVATASADLSAGMKSGDAKLESIGAITFGPEGILFAADPKGASLVAISTGDVTPRSGGKAIAIADINAEVAAVLGTSADEITIEDRTGVVQLDRLDDAHAIIIADSASGGADLREVALP